MLAAKRFLHLCPHSQSIEPGTGAFVLCVYLGVKDRGYFVFQFPINDDWRIRNGVLARDGIWSCGLNHGDVENWMNRMHALWQMKGE